MSAPRIAARPSLMVRNELSELPRVSSWVDEWARQHRLPSTLAQILDLCTAEVVTNIISYAHDDNAAHSIGLNLRMHEDLIRLEVEDEGKPFNPVENPAQVPRTNLEEGRIGGWGLRIVRHFADELCYRRVDARNRLTVIFRYSGSMPH